MGESVAEATVIKWTKNPGDHVDADETVMEIATDKVDSDVPSPVAGKLLEQFYKENDVVQVGAVIAIIETAGPDDDIQTPPPVQQPVAESQPNVTQTTSFENIIETPEPPQVTEVPAATTIFEAAAPETVIPEESSPPVFDERREEFEQPVPYTEQLEQQEPAVSGESVKNGGRFYSPLVKNIASQENISNAELDQIPGTGAEGRLTKDDLLNYIQNKYQPTPQTKSQPIVEEPAKVPYETFVNPESAATVSHEIEEKTEPEPVSEPDPVLAKEAQPEPEAETPQPQPQPTVETPKTEPVSQPISESAPKAAISVSGGDEIIEMDRMRRLIADHMVMSKQTSPHVTSFVEADVTNVVMWRDRIKNSFEKREGEKITFTPIFIEAVVRAIKDLPMINVQVNGTQIIKKKDINISMATALPSGNLIVPVIKKADELSLLGLTKAVNDLANRARTNKLKPDDIQGGTFTITNVGTFGNVMGTPIINQPQVAILAVGAIRKKPAVIETLQGDMIGIRHMMFLSLSYDHRVVDGALGGSFVRRVADYLENWEPSREI